MLVKLPSSSIHKKTKKRFVMVMAIVYLFSLQSNFLLSIPSTAFAFFTGEETTQLTGQEQTLTTGDGVDIVTTDSAFSGGLATSSGSDISGIGTSGETNVNLVTTGSSSCPSGASLSGDVSINGTTTDSTSCTSGDVSSGVYNTSGDLSSTPNSGENIQLTGADVGITTGSTDSGTGTATLSGQNTTTGYFTTQFASGTYDPKIIDLQKILKRLYMFVGSENGMYDLKTIEAVTQYQLSHNLIDLFRDDGEPGGFLGPKTRTAFNYEYVLYKQSLLDQLIKVTLPTHGGGYTMRPQNPRQVEDSKEYFLTNQFKLKDLFGFNVFEGKKDIDFSRIRGRIDLPLIFQSSNTLDGNSAEVLFVEGTVLKTESGAVFTGTLASPEFLDPSVADELTGQNILSVLDVGGNDEKILLENGSGEEISSIVKIPVPGQLSGALLDINYSNDGKTWTYMASQKVFLENGEPYVQFETNHFTLFSVGLPVGTFVINNDDVRAYDINVTLNSHVYGATHMRFSNTQAGLTSASWVAYATGYAWTLIDADDVHTVYAQFSGTNGIQSAFDTISVIRTTSNIKTLLVGEMSGAVAIDESNTNNFQTYGGITNPIVDGEQVYELDGASQYMQTGNIGITAYPFTFSAWVKPDTIAGTDAIMMMGNSATATTYWGISLVAGKATIVASNTTARTSSATATLVPGTWYHVVGVFASATSRILYVNGAQVATNTTSVTFASTNQQVRVGSYVGSTLSNYFDGQMDGIRIYNKALTVPEIQTIYNARQPILTTKSIHVGDFVINTGDNMTYVTGVALSMNIEGATHMRFSNTEAGLSSASWISYVTGYSWTLDGNTSGNKYVYAEFSGNGWKGLAQDSIFLDLVSDSTIRAGLHGNAISGSSYIRDVVVNRNWVNSGGILTVKDNGYDVYSLNGVDQCIYGANVPAITNYPFTFSAWVKPDTIAGTDAIMMMGNLTTTTMFWGISLVAGKATIVASNTTARTSSATATLVPGTWYHVVGVFASATSRILYVNGSQVATNTTSVTFASTSQYLNMGKYVGNGTTNYFDGNMDDMRLYTKVLTPTEISGLYTSRVSQILTPTATVTYDITGSTAGPVVATLTGFSESVTIVNNGGSNQYTFTGNGSFTFFFTNSAGNVGSAIASVDRITPTSGSLSISGPPTLSLGATSVNSSVNLLEKTFTGASEYFQVEDTIGADAGYYTTLEMTNLQYNTQTIANTNMYVKTVGGITLLSGTANANVITSIGTTYTNISSPLTFIMRSAGSNGGKTGTYGAQLAIKVDIPAFQKAGNYTGTIIYTIY